MVDVGIVVIGRNEGERLRDCLASISMATCPIVYVDSGSHDDSVALAKSFGAEVVELDPARPFSAARARNEGFAHLLEHSPGVRLVQFFDGDCEVVDGWIDAAVEFLGAHSDVAAVCGRRRERYPEKSIFNLLCDIEWNTPVGEAKAFGGDVMMRVDALLDSNGYRASLIAGEDTELGVRLRAAGWRIWRLDKEMTLHDAAITRFSQWWKRSKRTGYAIAEGASLHGTLPERFWIRESRSTRIWGLVIPLAALLASFWIGLWATVVLLVYPLQVQRLYLRGDGAPQNNYWHAVFLVLGKFPEMLGQAKFLAGRYSRIRPKLIEYK